jgi:hypothetical protein
MRRNASKPISAALLCAALLAGLPFLIACGGKTVAPEARTVQVQITDQGIQMPASLPSGVTTFQISNSGSSEHSFGLAGPAGDKKLDEPLKPGESASLDVVLDSGTYRVYSPVDQGQGAMQMALNVHPDTSPSRKG